MPVSIEQALYALEMHFGHKSFRPGQRGVVEALLAGRDVVKAIRRFAF